MKNMKKFMALALALVMVFALSANAFATGGEWLWTTGGRKLNESDIAAPDSSTYMVSNTYDASATVTLVMEAGDCLDYNTYEIVEDSAFRKVITVNVTDNISDDGINGVTVSCMLKAVNGTNGLVFNFDPEDEMLYMDAVTESGNTWQAGSLAYDGWQMRINDKYPVHAITGGYEGVNIFETPIHDGDVIHFFYGMPTELEVGGESMAANYIRATLAAQSDNSLTVQLQKHQMWIDQSDYMDPLFYVYGYENAGAGISAKLYNAAGNQVATGTSAADGTVTFNGSFASGTYIIQTASSLRAFDEDDDWYDFCNNTFFVNTGAYSKIVIE